MEKNKKINRRQFINKSFGFAGCIALGSCASMDRSFRPDKKYYDDEVIIVGGGLAGLSAAYMLKKNRIPFRLFEADRRLGGRVYSEKFGTTEQVVEYGAEYFSPEHKSLMELGKELHISYDEYSLDFNPEEAVYISGKKISNYQVLKGQAGNLSKALSKARQEIKIEITGSKSLISIVSVANLVDSEAARSYDKISTAQFIEKYVDGMSSLFRQYLAIYILNKYGVRSEDLSALHFLVTCPDFHDFILNKKKKLYRFSGGNQKFVEALANRVKSAIPNHLLRTGAPLGEINFNDSYIGLKFDVENDVYVINSKVVILAIPPPILNRLPGFYDLKLANAKRNAFRNIKPTNHTRLFWGLTSAQARLGPVGRMPVFGDFENQNFHLCPVGSQGKDFVLSSQRGGGLAANFSMQDAILEAESFVPNIKSNLSAEVQWIHWGQKKWSLGSGVAVGPNDYFETAKIMSEPECKGGLIFAGDYTSTHFRNSMEGAVESGQRAAQQAMKFLIEVRSS